MRCYICLKTVFGSGCITVPNHGAAHRDCFEAKQAMVRNFQGLNISDLTDEELTNLKDMVLAEENDRVGSSDDDIELF